MHTNTIKIIFLLSCFLFNSSPALANLQAAGKVESFSGVVWAETANKPSRKLKANDPIYSGEKISTAQRSSIAIRFSDGSLFSLGHKSAFTVDKYFYKPDKRSSGNIFITNILKGTFRFLSGLVAHKKPRAMKVKLAVRATIGIRGTHVMGEVIPRSEKDGVITEASAKIILLEPEEQGKKSAIIVSNKYGEVEIDKPGYGTDIPDEHSPPSPARKMQMNTIKNIMRAVRATTRVRVR